MSLRTIQKTSGGDLDTLAAASGVTRNTSETDVDLRERIWTADKVTEQERICGIGIAAAEAASIASSGSWDPNSPDAVSVLVGVEAMIRAAK